MIFLNNATITLDGTDCSDLANNLTITPTAPALTFTGVSGATVSDSGAESWSASLAFAQDWEDPASILNVLFNKSDPSSQDRTGVLTVYPSATATKGWEADITAVAPTLGGAGQAAMVATVVLPVSGRPRRVTRALPPVQG